MKIFLDSANKEEIKGAMKLIKIDGLTTNPSLMAKNSVEGTPSNMISFCEFVNGPVSIEVVSKTAHEMVKEAIRIAKLNPHINIKIPLTEEGLEAIQILKSPEIHIDKGIDVAINATLVFSANQALLAMQAGAEYISPFIGRINDAGGDGFKVLEEIVNIKHIYNFEGSEIIAASIRGVNDVKECAIRGADIVTIPFQILKKMIAHPQTTEGLKKFESDFEKIKDSWKL